MYRLISPSEVLGIAFVNSQPMDECCIDEATIIEAEYKFIKPVLGPLYDKLCSGGYPTLLSDYIKPALALYVKMLLLPSLGINIGSVGVSQARGANFSACTPEQMQIAVEQCRSSAYTLIGRAIEHIEGNPTLYPEYQKSRNILNNLKINGSIVL